jgi:hypothetical protein
VGFLDRIRPRRSTGEGDGEVHVLAVTHTFAGNHGDTIWRGGFAPADTGGALLDTSEHRTSDPRVFFCKVAGVHHLPSALADSRFDCGSGITLRSEANSGFGGSAVGIWDATGSIQVGYVPTTLSRTLTAQLRAGAKLGGQVISEYRLGSADGQRVALDVLVAPAGRLRLVEHGA